MNKRKRVAIFKHRVKKKKLEERRKALLLASGGTIKPVVKAAPKKEKEMPKPVKALADILKPKETAPVKKAAPKKEKVETVKAEPAANQPKKAPVKKKNTEDTGAIADEKAEAPKKAAVKRKKAETSGD